ncbi:hypothetical protein B0H12DRAFT_1328821, partial [Mycena haematopus]
MYLVNGHRAAAMHSHQPHTQISRHYARSLGLKVSPAVSTLFVSVSVALSARGSTSFFTHKPFDVHVADNLGADILLGGDWLALCRAAASSGDIVFAAGTYEVIFNGSAPVSVMRRGDLIDPSSSVSRGWPDVVASAEALTVLTSDGVPAVQGSAMQKELSLSAMQSPPAMQAKSSNRSQTNDLSPRNVRQRVSPISDESFDAAPSSLSV